MGIFEKENEELLGYDGHAFLYFALTVLTSMVLPWTWSLASGYMFPRPAAEMDFELSQKGTRGPQVRLCKTTLMEGRRHGAIEGAKARRFGPLALLKLGALAGCWGCLLWVLRELKDAPSELKSFDPHEILGVPRNAELREIKKAYRAKSLQHHPDKDKDNPLASVMFQQVSKAYAALTDETARSNYEKYGNPDGPVRMKMGIALHPILLVKERQVFILCFFFGFLFGVPMFIVCCNLRGSNVSTHGVSAETLKIFHACINIEVTKEDTVGLLCASSEVRRFPGGDLRELIEAMAASHPLPLEPGTVVQFAQATACAQKGRRAFLRSLGSDGLCEVDVWPASGQLPQREEEVEKKKVPLKVLAAAEPRVVCPFSDNSIRRSSALLWSHCWRLHRHMGTFVKMELTHSLLSSPKLCRAMISIAAHGEGDRADFFDVTRSCIALQRCLVQAIDFDDSPLLQLPCYLQAPRKDAPSLREVVANGGDESMLKRLGQQFSPAEVLDIQEFCRHAPLVELRCTTEVDDEKDIAEGDMASLTVTMTRTNLREAEVAGPVHAPLFPGVKYEEWWIIVYDNRSRRMVTADVILDTGRTASCKVNFMVPRPGEFKWTVFAMCDSYAGLDVQQEVVFHALRRNDVDRTIFVHPEDANIRSFFEEIMLGLEPEDQDSSSEEEEEPEARSAQQQKREAKKPAAVENAEPEEEAAEKPTDALAKADGGGNSESEEDPEAAAVPGGVFYQVMDSTGIFIYREPQEDKSLRLGSVPVDTIMRGFEGDGRPDGWLEVASLGAPQGQGVWMRIDGACTTEEDAGSEQGAPCKCLGGLTEQSLKILVKAQTPVILLRRWMKQAPTPLTAEDILEVREMDNQRARMLLEDLALRRLGDERFAELLDRAEALTDKFKTRIKKARGYFQSQNGIIWYVTPDGEVRGVNPDGGRIRDRVQVTPEDTLQLGPFRLDEDKTCSCIHWLRKDDAEKSWTWSRDQTLRTRVRLMTGEPAPRR
eukprot:TRINITY_DN16224_c0_g1_i3.p1 TRINITY_DN16224_c0_g1~~TRINITY_DN16224_c0_g1_i3.p1  ORF type:complete len:995 (+),score=195.26 TRINITY_DN16224_c0_g1_i3:104-3088(+)